MRKPKLPVSSDLQYLRANHSFDGGAYDRPTFTQRVSGTLPCLSSTRGRRRHDSPPASRQVVSLEPFLTTAILCRSPDPSPWQKPQPQPHPVHRDVSQPSIIMSPGTGLSPRVRHSMGKAYWERAQTRTGKVAEPLREFVWEKSAPALKCREHPIQHAPESYRRLQNPSVRSPPGASRLFSTNNSPVRTSQAEVGPPTSGSSNNTSNTMLDWYIASHQKLEKPKPKGKNQKKRKSKDDEIRTLVNKVGREGIITRTRFSKATHCHRDAVIIFLSPGSTGEVQDTGVFESASAIFGQHQVIEMKIPRSPNNWVPPRLDSIHLKGEEKRAVRVFDSCDEIRAKIEAYLHQPKAPNTHRFGQTLHAQLGATISKGVSHNQLKLFLAKEGSSAGAQSIVYYAAYVYFEKLRIAEGRPKSLHRLEMERRYPRGLKCKRR